jgi:hypothetical protein
MEKETFKADKARLHPTHRAMVEEVEQKVLAGDLRGALLQTLANARALIDAAEQAVQSATDADLRAVAGKELAEFEVAVNFLKAHQKDLLAA